MNGNEPQKIDSQYDNIIFKINQNTGTVGVYNDNKMFTEFKSEYFKTGFNFIKVDLWTQGEYVSVIDNTC